MTSRIAYMEADWISFYLDVEKAYMQALD